MQLLMQFQMEQLLTKHPKVKQFPTCGCDGVKLDELDSGLQDGVTGGSGSGGGGGSGWIFELGYPPVATGTEPGLDAVGTDSFSVPGAHGTSV